MRILFFGTPDYTIPYLDRMADQHTLCGVVTAPDRPAGRGRGLHCPAPGRWAAERGITLLQPENLTDPAFQEAVRTTKPDVGIIIAYGKIIPDAVFCIPSPGCFNLHFSLLPAYRGASPIESVLLNNETRSGVTMQRIVRELDAGDILCRQEITLPTEWHYPELFQALLTTGEEVLRQGLTLIGQGDYTLTPQDTSKISFCGKISPVDRAIDWSADSVSIRNRIRAFSGHRTAWSALKGTRYFFFRASAADTPHDQPPGTILQCDRHAFAVACGSGVLHVQEIQRENRKRMDILSFVNGNAVNTGDRFA